MASRCEMPNEINAFAGSVPCVPIPLITFPFIVTFFSERLFANAKPSRLRQVARALLVIVLWLGLFVFTVDAPFWAKDPPMTWNRPQYMYGWPFPWKSEFFRFNGVVMAVVVVFNLAFWLFYSLVLCGYRGAKKRTVIVFAACAIAVALAFAFPEITRYTPNRSPRARSATPTSFAHIFAHGQVQ